MYTFARGAGVTAAIEERLIMTPPFLCNYKPHKRCLVQKGSKCNAAMIDSLNKLLFNHFWKNEVSHLHHGLAVDFYHIMVSLEYDKKKNQYLVNVTIQNKNFFSLFTSSSTSAVKAPGHPVPRPTLFTISTKKMP